MDKANAANDLLPRRFRWRTVLIPLAFILVHWLAMNLVATVYLLVHTILQSGTMIAPETMLERTLIDQYPIIAILYSLLLIPIYLLFLFLSRRKDSRSLFRQPLQLHQLLPSIAVMIGALGLTNLWFNVLLHWSERSVRVDGLVQEYMEMAEAFAPTIGYAWLILGIVILAPVAEELLFRGIIQGELRKAMPEGVAIIVQALLFAVFHMQIIQVTYVIIPGILLGLVYAWTKTLWVPIIMHVAFNFLGSVVPSLVEGDEVLSAIVFYSQLAFIVIGALAMVYLYLRRRPALPTGGHARAIKTGV